MTFLGESLFRFLLLRIFPGGPASDLTLLERFHLLLSFHLSVPLPPLPSFFQLQSRYSTSRLLDQPSKAASIHLTRTLANQLAEKYVLVNAICPGVFPSLMTAYGLNENRELFDESQPTGEWSTSFFVSIPIAFSPSRRKLVERRILLS